MPNDGAPGFPHFVSGMGKAGDHNHHDFPQGQLGGPMVQRTLTDVKMVNPNRPELTRRDDPSIWRCPNCRTVYVAPYAISCGCCTVPVTK